MARYNFGGALTDFAITSPSARANAVFAQPNATGSVYAARTGGSALTDLLDSTGSATSTVSTDANGFVKRFQGPDGYAELWVDFGGGSRFFQRAVDGAASASGLPVDGSNAAGVDKTGVADSAAAIQAVLDANAQVADSGIQKVVRLQGVFNLGTAGITIKGSLDASNAVFHYSGTGTAVRIGNSAAGQLQLINVSLGDIICDNKPAGASWVAGSVGLEVRNTFRSTISYKRIINFETGLYLTGDGSYGQQGTAYNTFLMGTLNNNLVNQKLLALDASGFVTENTFIGGSFAHSDGTYPVSGMRHVLYGSSTRTSGSNNRWIGCSMEGQREEYALDVYGVDNMWLWCRWETPTAGQPIIWRSTAARNLILGGYQVSETATRQTIETGAQANNIVGTQSIEFNTVGDGGAVFAIDSSTGGTPSALTIMPSRWRQSSYTTASNYAFKFASDKLLFKAATDTNIRWGVDYTNRKMTLGAGINTNAQAILWGANSPEGVQTASPGAEYFAYSGTSFGRFVKGSGTGNTGWQAAGFQPFTTAGRPTAASAGIGGAYFDTTLNKPVWSDGTSWRDATGTTV